jgi:ammonium transporter, Amt family
VLGFLLGAISYFGAHWLKHGLHIDDALEVTVIHGVTGAVGAIFNGFAADKDTNPDIMYSGVYKGSGKLLGIQVW